MTTATLDIVPPQRFGSLLAGVRAERGLSLADVAARASVDEDVLASVEAGELPVSDGALDPLLVGYGTTIDELLPDRRDVLVDLDAGELVVADAATALEGSPSADDVLEAYLALVHSLRRTEPGTPIVLRGADLGVLATVLDLPEAEVEARLLHLMAHPTEEVGRLTKIFRRRIVLPIVGAVVVATGIGTVLVLRDDAPAPPATTTVRDYGETVPPPEIGGAATLQRNDDGTLSYTSDAAPTP